MKVLLNQKNKDLFSASFEIIENDEIIGTIFLQGQLGTREVKLTGKIYDKEFSMEREIRGKGKFRPYSISENDNVVGEVYQAEIKKGFFTCMPYKKCIYNGNEYNSYGVSLSNKAANCLYFNDSQIAQYEKSATTYNDLHNFEIYCRTKNEVFISVINAIYGYIIACYKAGEKPIQSVRVYSSNDKDWIDKYDPDWIKNLQTKECE